MHGQPNMHFNVKHSALIEAFYRLANDETVFLSLGER